MSITFIIINLYVLNNRFTLVFSFFLSQPNSFAPETTCSPTYVPLPVSGLLFPYEIGLIQYTLPVCCYYLTRPVISTNTLLLVFPAWLLELVPHYADFFLFDILLTVRIGSTYYYCVLNI